MTQRVPQSTSFLCVFKAYLASDHTSEATGKTIAITISKNGGAFGNPNAGATNATEISSGWYKVTLDTTDTGTLGAIAVRGAVALIDDVGILLEVVSATSGGYTNLDAAVSSRMATYTQPTGFLAATFPGTVASTTNITSATGVDVTKWNGGTIPAVNVTGVPLVDLKYTLGTISPAAAGSVSPDWGQVVNKTTTNALTGTTIATTQTIATVTNQLTAAQIATGVWQDATAGDFTTASSIGKALYIANVAPGGSGGLLISGANAGTTTFGALTVTGATTHTGNFVLSDGLTISAPSTLNRAGITITGNGTGAAISGTGGTTGQGILIAGGGTSGDGIKVTTTSGHGINLAPVGTSMHGLFATGGNGGTSDGIKAAAGTGGVDIRGNITGNLVGTVSTLTTYTGNTVQTGDSFARLGVAGAGLTALGDTRIANLDAAVTSRMATYTQPSGFLAATFPSGTVANTTNITAGTITTATNLTTNNDKTGYALTADFRIKKNTALAAFPFRMTDSTDHFTPKTGLTVTGTVSQDGGAFGALTNAVSETGNGWYKVSFAAADMNADTVALKFTATGADQLDITVVTQTE
jgi:hypothetical protein